MSGIRVFIDCDNVSYRFFPRIKSELDTLDGRILKISVYGDWTKPETKSWLEISKANGYEPVLALRYVGLKESSDIRMAVDIINSFHTNKEIEKYCIISNDTDFIHIINLLKDRNISVIGMGLRRNCEVLKNTYTKYISIDTYNTSKIYYDSLKIIKSEINLMEYIFADALYSRIKNKYPYFSYTDYGYTSFRKFILDNYNKLYNITRVKDRLCIELNN